MQTRVSTKGQIVLPEPVRRRLGIQAGDHLDVEVEDSRIVLLHRRQRKPAVRIITSPITGLPVLSLIRKDAPKLTSKEVHEGLADFP